MTFLGDRWTLGLDVARGIRATTAQASALGMIVTELVINACKHAFRDDQGGALTARLQPDGSGCRLCIADDGPGLPEGLDPRRSDGLGMRLVRSLVRQLEGTLDIDRGPPGTRFVVTFPIRPRCEEGQEASRGWRGDRSIA